MYFDTVKVAQKIRNARIAQNMTQMNLADAMEVSYQAVSNWERGNSMPDIGRLRQLCDILDISVEELLGGGEGARTVAKVVESEGNGSRPDITMEELQEVAPLLPPRETEKIVEEGIGQEEKLDIKKIIPLAPFLDREYLDKLVDRVCEVGDLEGMAGLAPFLSRQSLDKLADRFSGSADIEKLTGLAPFLSRGALDKLVEQFSGKQDIRKLAALAPFLSRETLDKLVSRVLAEGGSISGIVVLCPFLPRETVRKIADALMKGGNFSELGSVAPFC